MLDEHQHVQSLQQHRVHVQEVDRDDPRGPGCQELPPRRARPARRRIDARSTQDLPHRGRRHRHAELDQFAVDPAVSPPRILPGRADDQAGDARDRRRAAGLATPARVVLAAGEFAVPGQECRGSHGKISVQRLRSGTGLRRTRSGGRARYGIEAALEDRTVTDGTGPARRWARWLLSSMEGWFPVWQETGIPIQCGVLAAALSCRSHRIGPADLAEPREVAVMGVHLQSVLDSECR